MAAVTDRARGAVAACVALLLLGCAPSGAQEPSRADLLTAARAVMGAAPYVALATVDASGRPSVRTMDARPPDAEMVVWMATNPRSRKLSQLAADPRVAVHYLDADGPGYVTLHGTVEIVTRPEVIAAEWYDAWTPFYPDAAVDAVLLRVTPEWLEVVSGSHGASGDAETWRAHVVEFVEGSAGR